MRWRRSNKRPKWFKAVRRLDEAEGNKRLKPVKFKQFRFERNPCTYSYKRLKIDVKSVSEWKEPNPLLDIFDEEDCIIVVAELKGFKKENIKIKLEKGQLTLSARTQNRKYYKRLNLPDIVVPESMHTTYKNGVLEIRLKKAVGKSAISRLVG